MRLAFVDLITFAKFWNSSIFIVNLFESRAYMHNVTKFGDSEVDWNLENYLTIRESLLTAE